MFGFGRRDEIVLGTTAPPLPFPTLRLGPEDQRLHAAIWGKTGSGKSKLLQSIFLQHLAQGRGVGLIEPHHDLSFDTLSSLAADGFFQDERAFDRLVYLDWGAGFVPFNILAPGRGGESDPYTVASNTMDAFIRCWPALEDAPTFQMLFIASAMTLLANGLTLTFILQLLTDLPFRRACLARVTDPVVRSAFAAYDRLGRMQIQEAGSTLRRAFLTAAAPALRYTLGAPHNALDFRRLMDEGVSFIINLGNIQDYHTRHLVGALLLVQIEQAALSRTDLLPHQRRPFTLLVDEWPAFGATASQLSPVLSQARKFGLTLYLAAQSLFQVSTERLRAAVENVKLSISFGLGRDSAEVQARHIAQVDPYAVKEEGLTETQHAQYLSLAEQYELWAGQLRDLSPRHAFVKLHDCSPARIKTLPVREPRVSDHELARVLDTYRQKYQWTRAEAEAAISRISLPDRPARTPPVQAFRRYFAAPEGDAAEPVHWSDGLGERYPMV